MFFRKFIKFIIWTWDPRRNEDFFSVTIPRNNNMLDFIDFIPKGRGRGFIELERRGDTFKNIYRHTLVDTNWAPTEKIYRIFSKTLRPVCAKVCCHQHPDTNEPEEFTKVNIRAFNYSIGIHHNDFINKSFWR